MDDINEALSVALEYEEQARQIYDEFSRKTLNPVLKATFVFLAGQEELHKKEIQDYIDHKGIGYSSKEVSSDIKEFFDKIVVDKIEMLEISGDDESAHKTAMEFENKLYNFYLEQKQNTNDENVMDFLSFMMKQENAHYVLLQKTFDYMSDPLAFLAMDEDWNFES